MLKKKFIYKTIALASLALLFLSVIPAFSQSMEVDYLCELGKTFYIQGKTDDALSEFTKVLVLEPNNPLAKDYINKIFNGELRYREEPVKPKPSVVIQERKIQKAQETPVAAQAQKPALTKEEAMDQALNNNSKSTEPIWIPPYTPSKDKDMLNEKEKKEGIKVGPLRVSGDMQVSFGVTSNDFIWKRANFDLNEKFFSWRMLSNSVYNRGFNTYDPAIYDSLNINLDTENKEGFNFHANIAVDPWSFTGKSSKMTVGSGADTADIQLLYWSNTGYTLNHTYHSSIYGAALNLPEIKVINGKAVATTASGYTITESYIDMQFQPIRELWLDYTNDIVKFRAFPMAYQNQAYTSDDPLNISNHGIWWKDSKWLRSYTPGVFHAGDFLNPATFTKGYWDDSHSLHTNTLLDNFKL